MNEIIRKSRSEDKRNRRKHHLEESFNTLKLFKKKSKVKSISKENVNNSKTIHSKWKNSEKFSITRDKTENSKLNWKISINSFLRRSSVYALNQVGNSESIPRKLLWIIILIFGILGCITQVSQFLVAYFEHPIVINRNIISPRYQEFPAITVCNMNSIRKEFLQCLEKNLNSENCSFGGKNSHLNRTDDPITPDCLKIWTRFNNPTRNTLWFRKLSSQTFENKVIYGHQRENFIRSCTFKNSQCAPFELTVTHRYGNCYTFNSVRDKNNLILTQAGPNPKSSLELELDIEVYKYVPYTDSVGARVQIHNPHFHQNIESEGINVGPGFKTYVGLSKEVIFRLPPPYKDHCKDYNLNDSQSLCFERCELDPILSACSCSADRSMQSNVKQCDVNSASFLCCVFNLSKTISSMKDCYCPLPCHETKYHSLISYAEWPSEEYYVNNKLEFISNEQKKILSFEEVRQTRLKLVVYFDTLDETVYRQGALYQSSDVFSQIGGQMGLWLGLSLIIIFELMETIIVLFNNSFSFR